MKTVKQLVDDIRNEEIALNGKLDKLEFFMMTEDFVKITAAQKRLLVRQHKIMGEYKGILIQRAHLLNAENKKKKKTDAEEITRPAPNSPCKNCRFAEPCVPGGLLKRCTKENNDAETYSCFQERA